MEIVFAQIWNAGNGHLLHKCVPEKGYECEVTGIQPLPERSYTLSVGWSRRMIMYHDNSAVGNCMVISYRNVT